MRSGFDSPAAHVFLEILVEVQYLDSRMAINMSGIMLIFMRESRTVQFRTMLLGHLLSAGIAIDTLFKGLDHLGAVCCIIVTLNLMDRLA